MKQFLLAMLVIIASAPSYAAHNGHDLLKWCQSAANYDSEALINDPIKHSIKAYKCVSYIRGFVDHSNLSQLLLKKFAHSNPTLFCLPGKANAYTVTKVYVKWANKHPENLHETGRINLWFALMDAYPCD